LYLVVPLLRQYDIRIVVTTYNQLYININNNADFKCSAHDPILEKPSSGDNQNQNQALVTLDETKVLLPQALVTLDETKVLLPQALVTLADFSYPF
jgi:hypothetical protein